MQKQDEMHKDLVHSELELLRGQQWDEDDGARLRTLREQREWSQEKLAEEVAARLDVPAEKKPHRNTIGNWEGARVQPPPEAIMAAAVALDVPLAALWQPKGQRAVAYASGMEEVVEIVQASLDAARLRISSMREAADAAARARRVEQEEHLPDERTGTVDEGG